VISVSCIEVSLGTAVDDIITNGGTADDGTVPVGKVAFSMALSAIALSSTLGTETTTRYRSPCVGTLVGPGQIFVIGIFTSFISLIYDGVIFCVLISHTTTVKRKTIKKTLALIIAVVMLASFCAGIIYSVKAIRVNAAESDYGSSARGMCVMDVATGRVYFEKGADTKMGMASTTKVVTALTVLENVSNVDAKVKINDKAIGIEGSSIYLQKGEELTIRELLYGLMLRSGNDTAVALALAVSSSVEDFAKLMNETAKKYGAVNSNFTNPHGLDDKQHYTTARDLAKVAAAALKNPIFTEIVSAKSKRISGVDMPRMLINKNRLLKSLDGCIGVKTGFTKKCGRCFVGAREVNGQKTVCVVLNCGPMFEETAALLKQAQDIYVNKVILAKDEIFTDGNGRKAVAIGDFQYPLSENEFNELEIKINDGRVQILLYGKVIYEDDCVSIDVG
jgi:D-alanyl-D-alanine carboxypeptidase